MSHHLVNHIKHPELRSDNTLNVVMPYTNTTRFQSRLRLAREFIERMQATPNVKLHIVEAAYGDRQHEVTVHSNPQHLQLRINSEIWVKENLVNLGVRYLLPKDWKYVAWVDADVEFRDQHWAQEALHQLQHTPLIQPWQQCLDLGHSGNVMSTHQSFGFMHQMGVRKQETSEQPYQYAHCGYAWCGTREFWEATGGGLIDFAILGSGDHHMAWGAIGQVDVSVHQRMSAGYLRRCREWQQRVTRVTNKEIGFSNGRIDHAWHGSKARRYYKERWQILVEHAFDPDKDLTYDNQGVIHLIGKPGLEQAVRKYNRSRQEDGIEE